MSAIELYAGFDGGGSKTLCALSDKDGNLLSLGAGGPSNFRYCGEETAIKSMKDALNGAFEAAKIPKQRLTVAYVSSATIPTYGGNAYVDFFSQCVDAEQVFCEGDLYPIWYGEAGENPAVVLIIGTGSVAYLFRGKSTIRAGGWGPQVGDEGSGYDIGARAMRKALRMFDGREVKDEEFYKALLNHFNVSLPTEFIGIAKSDDARARIASAAGFVCALGENGNVASFDILGGAAKEAAALVIAAVKRDKNDDALPVILSGGLTSSKLYAGLIRSKIVEQEERISAVEAAKAKPALVCAALALKQAGKTEAAQRLVKAARGEG